MYIQFSVDLYHEKSFFPNVVSFIRVHTQVLKVLKSS